MSGKQDRKARQVARIIARDYDRGVRKIAKPPLWRRLWGWIFPPVLNSWWERFNRNHGAAMHSAIKTTAHVARKSGRK